jgi:hypothetical protein
VQRGGVAGDVEDDCGLLPFGALAERPVVHIVDLVRAGRGVDPQPQAGPVADLVGPDRRGESHPAAGVAGGRDALHERAEARRIGDAGAQPQPDHATAVVAACVRHQPGLVAPAVGAGHVPRCWHRLKRGTAEHRAQRLRVVLLGLGHPGADQALEILVVWHCEQPPSRRPPQRSWQSRPEDRRVLGIPEQKVRGYSHLRTWRIPRWGGAAGLGVGPRPASMMHRGSEPGQRFGVPVGYASDIA